MDVSLESLIAGALKISESQVTEELEFQAILEWDSLGHMEIMLALEQALDKEIEPDLIVELASVPSIRKFLEESRGSG